jgi:hypothetical protein
MRRGLGKGPVEVAVGLGTILLQGADLEVGAPSSDGDGLG